jgi:GntR family transcriptional regulator
MSTLKYETLRSYLMDLIDHELAPHAQLPTERSLAEQFSVSRMTARRALDQLQSEQRVYRIQGAGTFVADPPITKTVELTSFSDDMIRRGFVPGARLKLVETRPAGSDLGFHLRISPAQSVTCVERIRTADGTPMCLERSYLPTDAVPGLQTLQLTGSLYELIRERYGLVIVSAEQTARAVVLSEADAESLEVAPFSPALLVERTGLDVRRRPVERAVSVYRGDRYAYEFTLHRDPPEPR